MNDIEKRAFEWVSDKSWINSLTCREYARYGYEEGYKQALEDLAGEVQHMRKAIEEEIK